MKPQIAIASLYLFSQLHHVLSESLTQAALVTGKLYACVSQSNKLHVRKQKATTVCQSVEHNVASQSVCICWICRLLPSFSANTRTLIKCPKNYDMQVKIKSLKSKSKSTERIRVRRESKCRTGVLGLECYNSASGCPLHPTLGLLSPQSVTALSVGWPQRAGSHDTPTMTFTHLSRPYVTHGHQPLRCRRRFFGTPLSDWNAATWWAPLMYWP